MKEWIKIIIACISFAFTVTIFIYTNFQTKVEAHSAETTSNNRLDRIESKIDWIIEALTRDKL